MLGGTKLLPKVRVTAQKPIKRQVGRKEALLCFRGQQLVVGGRADQRSTSPPDNQWTRAFIDRGGGGGTCTNSTGSSDIHLEIGHAVI